MTRWIAGEATALPARRRNLLGGMLGLLALPGLVSAARATETTLAIGGNGGAAGTMRDLARAFIVRRPDVAFRFLPNLGSGGGIAAVLAGAASLAHSGRPLSPREQQAGARALPYGRTPLALAVHPAVGVRDVTLAEAARIYAGENTAWPDGMPIRTIRRGLHETTIQALAAASPGMRLAVERLQRRPGLLAAATDQENAQALETVHGAFGVIGLAQYLTEMRSIALLRLDGEPPEAAVDPGRRYPIWVEMALVLPGTPTPAARDFVDFVFAPVGRATLIATGHEPIGRSAS